MKKKLCKPREYCCICCCFDSDCDDNCDDSDSIYNYDESEDKRKLLTMQEPVRDAGVPTTPQVHVTVNSVQPENDLMPMVQSLRSNAPKLENKVLFDAMQEMHSRYPQQESSPVENLMFAPFPDTGFGQSLLGYLIFSLRFNINDSIFVVHLHAAHNLPKKDPNGYSDPYVKIFLLPDKSKKEVSKIKFKNLNPEWNEKFNFKGLTCKKLREKELCLQVYDYDRIGWDDLIGEIRIPLQFDFSEISQKEKMYNCDLKEVPSKSTNCGNIHLSLCYSMKHANISITIIKATNLRVMDLGGLADPYVKVWLLSDGRRIEKRKTKIIKNSLNPEFNETFVFKHGFRNFNSIALEVIVCDYDFIGRNEVVGMILLGYKSGFKENKHWTQMKSRPNENIEEVHTLKQFYPSIYA